MDKNKTKVWNSDNTESLKVIKKTVITVTAIGGLCYLEAQALAAGIDGALFAGVVAAIAGLGGYELKGILKK